MRGRYAQALDAASGQLLVDQADLVLQFAPDTDLRRQRALVQSDVAEVRRLSELRARSTEICKADPGAEPGPPPVTIVEP